MTGPAIAAVRPMVSDVPTGEHKRFVVSHPRHTPFALRPQWSRSPR